MHQSADRPVFDDLPRLATKGLTAQQQFSLGLDNFHLKVRLPSAKTVAQSFRVHRAEGAGTRLYCMKFPYSNLS